jgi:hypothetical protein
VGLGRAFNCAHVASLYRSAHYGGIDVISENKQRNLRTCPSSVLLLAQQGATWLNNTSV